MNEDFVPVKLSKKLKDKGFDKPCVAYYVSSCSKLYFNITQLRGRTVEDCFISRNTQHGNSGITLTDAPTISQVLKWLREEKKIYIEIFLYDGKYSYLVKSITQICEDDLFHKCLNEDTVDEEYQFYEEAALAGIEYVLNNLI